MTPLVRRLQRGPSGFVHRVRLGRSERLRARAEESAGQPRRSADLLEQAIATHPGVVPVAWLRKAPALHVEAGSEPRVVDAAHERALLRSPHHGPLAKAYAASLRARDPAMAVDRLVALQDRAPRPLPAVLLQVLGGRDDDRVRPRVEPWLAVWEQTPAAQVIERVWQAWGSFGEPEPADVEALAKLPPAAVRLFFVGRPPRRVGLDEAVAENLTGSTEALTWFSREFLVSDNPATWPARDWPSEAARTRHEDVRDPRLGFQTRLVRDHRLLLRDPGSGAEVAPFDSTIVLGRVTYSFGDERLFVLMTGGYAGMAAFVYDVGRHQLVDLGADLPWHMTVERVGTMLAHLMLRATVTLRESHAAALERRHDTSPRHVVMFVHSVENPAHHLSNTFPGIERIVDHDLVSHIDEVLTVKRSEFYGTFTEVFPEFTATPAVEVDPHIDLDPHPYSPDHVLVMPGGYFIRRALVERLVDRLSAMPRAVDGVEPPVPAPFPIVWLGVRVGTRSWVDQESGLVRVIDRIREQWPEALFVVDGFSRPMGRDLVSTRWREAIGFMSALADRIAAATEPGRVVNLVGDRLRENVLWAQAADVYLTPSGSSQHKVGWLGDAPGVIYGPPRIAALPPERRIGSTESELGVIPVAIVGDVASRGELFSAADTRTNTENIHLDVDEIAATVLGLIATIADRPRQTARYPDDHE